ncbi:MAG: SPFH domain-containing protein [Candidatus Hodarchaeota archaeon]
MKGVDYLTEREYCQVVNKLTGKIRLVSGPARLKFTLGLFEGIRYGKKFKKIILKENQYAIINNPYSKEEKKVLYGEREIRVGPDIFPLHPGEKMEGNVTDVHVLPQGSGLLIEAVDDFLDGDIQRTAGDQWIIKGPRSFIPNKHETIIEEIEGIALPENMGIYIKNTQTGEIRLEKGPKTIMLQPWEERYHKTYTVSELEAIRYRDGFDRTVAQPLWVLEKEVTKIMTEENQRIVFGPKVLLLGPYERPYIMRIAGGTPKNSKRLKIWKIKLGPNFSTDILEVRTRDNAVLRIRYRLKWHINVDKENPDKIFAVSDFVGNMTEMMASIIRDEAANHNFEELHSKASEIMKRAIFNDNESYLFEENGLEITNIDIKEIVPSDEEIASQMNDAIKSNMNIYVNKIKQEAEIEAEKQEILGRMEIEEKRQELIRRENENKKLEVVGLAEMEAQAARVRAQGEADSLMLLENAKNSGELLFLKSQIDELGGVEKFLALEKLKALNISKMAIIPTDSKMFLPVEDILE